MILSIILFLLKPLTWLLTSLALYFALAVSVTAALRLYSIKWARRNKLPVSGRDAVLITGATSGIGLAVAKHLYKLGYSVVVGFYNSKESGYAELKQLAGKSRANAQQRMLFVEMDVRSDESIRNAYDQCAAQLKEHKLSLYALVNNAGLGSLQPYAWLPRKTIRSLVETNLLGTMLMTREFLPLIIQSRGRILNVSSGLALAPGPTYTTYGCTKLAQIYFTTSLNSELSEQYGVKSVAIIPHNFVKNTNIGGANVKNNELAWQELRAEEKELYKRQYDEHLRKAKLLQDTIAQHGQRAATRSAGSKKQPAGFLGQLISSLKGESEVLSIEESGAIDSFEDALRLPDPPEHIFAGDEVFKFGVGSILLSLPTSCLRFVGSAVSPSLYK